MQKWEYATVPLLVHATKQILDNWGDDGWELVALVPRAQRRAARGVHEAAQGGFMTAGAAPGGSPEERLAALGLELPVVTPPLAAYVPAVRSGNYVYTSGQLPMVDGALMMTGKVGAGVSVTEAAGLARVCALNALAAVASVTGRLSAVRRVVKVVGFVASAPDFTGQAQVDQRGQRAAARGVRRGRQARPQRGRHGRAAAGHPGRGRADRRGQ